MTYPNRDPTLYWRRALRLAAVAAVMVLPAVPGLDDDPAPSLDPSALSVEWGHCWAVQHEADLLCIYDAGDPVRVWIDHPRAPEAQLLVDGLEVAADRYSLDEEPRGLGYRVHIPAGALELTVEVPGRSGVQSWGLLLRDAARYHAAAQPESVRVEYQAALASDEIPRIVEATERLAEHFVSTHELSWAVLILAGTSFQLQRLRAFEAAAQMLERAALLGASFPAGRGTVSTYLGLLRWSQGRLHEAAELLRNGARYALRVEDPLGTDAVPIYAEALAELGYYAEARHWARRALSLDPLPCERAAVLRTVGWINQLLRARGEPHDDPRPYLREAIELFRTQTECLNTEAGAWLSLALLSNEDGDITAAKELLAAIDLEQLSNEDRVRAADLGVRLGLAQGLESVELWQVWRELERVAQVVDDDDARWRVEVRQGQILILDGDDDAAIDALEAAEHRLDRLVRAQAVVGVGRTAISDRYLDGTMALVSRRVEQGRPAEALCVAREARARRRSAAVGLDGLPPSARARMEERLLRYREHKHLEELTLALIPQRPHSEAETLRHEAAQHSKAANEVIDTLVEALSEASHSPRCDELVAAAPDELLVDLYPRAHDWLVLVQDHRSNRAYEITTPDAETLADPEALGRILLDPLSDALAAAGSVRVLAHRQAQQIDVHLLPWRGRPLLAHMPVTYGVELPALPNPAPGGPPRALLIADPTDTLTNAAREVEEARSRLHAAGWMTDVPVSADSDAPASGLSFEGYSLLHYAAHTAQDRQTDARMWAPHPAGEAGNLPHLQIGRAARLEVHDILAMRPVPPVAFLAGCRTGVVELDTGTTSMALAFLLADGHQVVASRDEVGDARAVEVASRFYEAFGAPEQPDVAEAMHRVQLQLHAQGQAVPYRVWVR